MEGLEIIGGRIYFMGYLVGEIVEGAPPSVVEYFEQMLKDGIEPAFEDPTY